LCVSAVASSIAGCWVVAVAAFCYILIQNYFYLYLLFGFGFGYVVLSSIGYSM
jgi:hypothetical protein